MVSSPCTDFISFSRSVGKTPTKQTAVSHSTVEAEIAAADHAIRTSGLPALHLWERLLQIDLFQDNQATARIMSTGRAPTLRDIKMTHSRSVLDQRTSSQRLY